MLQGVKPADVQSAKIADTVGIFHHVFDKEDKISNIWFLRQLSHDELENKVCSNPTCTVSAIPSICALSLAWLPLPQSSACSAGAK